MGPTKAGYWRVVPIGEELESFLKGIRSTCKGRKSVLPRFSDWEKGRGAHVLRAGSSHFMVGVRLKRFIDRHLAASVGNFRTTYIRKPSFVQALRRC